MHVLLARQLKRLGLSPETPPGGIEGEALLQHASRVYESADSDRYTLERSLAISSEELHALYQDLQERSASTLAMERDRLQTIMASMADGLYVLDLQDRVTFINQEAARLMGADETSVIGRTLVELGSILPDQRARVADVFDRLKATGAPIRGEHWTVARADEWVTAP